MLCFSQDPRRLAPLAFAHGSGLRWERPHLAAYRRCRAQGVPRMRRQPGMHKVRISTAQIVHIDRCTHFACPSQQLDVRSGREGQRREQHRGVGILRGASPFLYSGFPYSSAGTRQSQAALAQVHPGTAPQACTRTSRTRVSATSRSSNGATPSCCINSPFARAAAERENGEAETVSSGSWRCWKGCRCLSSAR